MTDKANLFHFMESVLTKRLMLAIVLVASFFLVTPLSAAEASSVGFPMYAWGQDSPVPAHTPTRIGDNRWIASATALGGFFAISESGHLYAWGAAGTAAQMGQGGSGTSAILTEPTQIGTANNWVSVSAMSWNAVAINADGELFRWGSSMGLWPTQNVPVRVDAATNWIYASIGSSGHGGPLFAINDDGELWAMGVNGSGQLGTGDTADLNVMTRIGNRSDWLTISTGSSYTLGITENGWLWSWGSNANGRTGQGVSTGSTLAPTRIGMADNWTEVRATASTNSGVGAINASGELWTWGNNVHGQLGNGTTGGGYISSPERAGTATNWVSLSGGNAHFLAFNSDGGLYAWGNNDQGQLGLGDTEHRNAPTFVLQTYGHSLVSRGGGPRTLMLIHTAPAEASSILEKRLQKPEGTNLLTSKTFTFNLAPHSFNGNTANTAPLPNIPNRIITLNATPEPIPAGGIITRTDTVDVLDGISFEQAGVFAWRVTELPTTGITPPSNMVDSQAVYELRVYVSQEPGIGGDFYVAALTLHRIYNDAGVALNPPQKTTEFAFTNIYTRTTTGTNDCFGALVVSKNVTGSFAPLNTVFDFDVTLTRTALCPESRTFTGQVYNAAGAAVGSPITFTSGTATPVNLTHGQRLVIDEFLVGTRFAVTELAVPNFAASVAVRANGVVINVTPNQEPNQNLFTGNHMAGDNENSAAFTNVYFFAPPTGIVTGNAPTALPVIAAIGVALLLVSKHRKRIEELPSS